MPDDFMLEPDAIEPERSRPVRVVTSGGLAPTETAIPTTRTKATTPAYLPCPQCQAMVLTGVTASGTVLAVEPSRRCWSEVWANQEARPLLQMSRAMPEHVCRVATITKETVSWPQS
jgi:hypothetical protein